MKRASWEEEPKENAQINKNQEGEVVTGCAMMNDFLKHIWWIA